MVSFAAEADTPVEAPVAPDPELERTFSPPASADGPAVRQALIGGGRRDDKLPMSVRSGPVGFVVARLRDRRIVARYNPDQGFIPASVTKVPTAIYAIETLGLDHTFSTRVIVTGPVRNGVLKGDIYLVGGGDPTLDTAELYDLVKALKDAGITKVEGSFYFDDGALPFMPEIEPGQPVYASYNPGVSGLSLNFNRVQIRWKRLKKNKYQIELYAASAGRAIIAPGFDSGLLPKNDKALFRRDSIERRGVEVERWRVSKRSLGRGGRRWLPVRDPSTYAAQVFRALAKDAGVTIGSPTRGDAPSLGSDPDGPRVIAEHQSAPLKRILRGMLKFSTNLTAENVGLVATGVRRLSGDGLGAPGGDPSRSLKASGEAMAAWINEEYGLIGGNGPEGAPMMLFNHSGLTAGSRMTPRAMVQLLVNVAEDQELFDAFYEIMPVRRGRGARKSAIVRAKTGTIFYGRGLAGYIECRKSGEIYAFAYFNSDPEARVRFDQQIDVTSPSPPRGASAWLTRAVSVEKALMKRWTKKYCG